MSAELAVATERNVRCSVHTRKVTAQVPKESLSELFSRLESPSILGGNSASERFSYWAAEPREIFEFTAADNEPFIKLAKVLGKYKLLDKSPDTPPGMFCGGWIGYLSYELGRYIEKVPQTAVDDLHMPLIRLCFYDRVICFDHRERCFWLIALELNDDESPENKRSQLQHLLEGAQDERVVELPAPDYDAIDVSRINCNMSKQYYLDAVGRIRRYIYDGDVYQVNFSQRFECDYDAPPIDLYHWENRFNPSPYAAYIDTGGFQLVSASPEMFIAIDSGVISTKPIKGTRPRICGADNFNAANFRELMNSEKEQAELNMIIDLERNDLGRICEYGTIKVVQPRTIEEYPTVFHAVATVEGKLRPQITFRDILRAMFPGGSITGAPKIASMQIIDELEPAQRGIYTGSIGFISIDGAVSLNIAIRTIIIAQNKAHAQTGGGIVADSDPQAEWEETITKARALLAGIRAIQNDR